MLFLSPFQQQIINQIRFDGANGQMSNKQIAQAIVKEWRNSQSIRDMLTAQDYYKVNNAAISKKKRTFLSPHENSDCEITYSEIENTSLSNFKIKSPILRMAIDQKINYGFSKPFTLEVSRKDGAENTEELDIYQKAWMDFLSDETRETIVRIASDAMINGIGWGFVTLDEAGKLQIVDMETETIYPAWLDRAHKKLDYAVRDYTTRHVSPDGSEDIRRVEFWSAEDVEFYLDEGSEWRKDTEAEILALGSNDLPETDGIPHLMYSGWGRVPFVAMRANNDELPLLNIIKSFLDAIDMLLSKMGDTIAEDMDAILMLKNHDPSVRELIATRNAIKNVGVISVDGDNGDGKYLKNEPNVTAIMAVIEKYRADLLEASSTLDSQKLQMGTSVSGVALKMLFQPIDIYMNGAEKHFKSFMSDQLKYFFDKALEMAGVGSFDAWQGYNIKCALDRDMMMNETEIIDNIMKMQGQLSQQTLDTMNPYVSSHKEEQARRDEEQETIANDTDMMRQIAKMMQTMQAQQEQGGINDEQ